MAELHKAPWPDWKTVSLIGRGSFGTVYLIQRKLVDDDTESAALKVITIPQNPGDVEELYSEGYDEKSISATYHSYLKSIVAEYSLMRKMDGSANIVNCKDIRYIRQDNGIGWDIYIRMELLTPLMKALPANAPEDTVIRIAKDICSALVLCKKHEIVHRDIKPQNIFVSSNGDYKLGDFGIAKTVEKTMGGTKVGTYKYMAPEVYNNQPYGSAADIYSLGLVLYWLLNERRMPFMPLPPATPKAGQDEAARHRRLSGEKLPAPAHGSAALKRIVLKACAYDPRERYASAAAMLEDLQKLTLGTKAAYATAPSDGRFKDRQEDDRTTATVFAAAAKAKAAGGVAEDAESTVYSSFAAKSPPAKKKQAKAAHILKATPNKKTQKKNGWKFALVGLAVILGLALFLLPEFYSGELPEFNWILGSGDTQPVQTTEGSLPPEHNPFPEHTDTQPVQMTEGSTTAPEDDPSMGTADTKPSSSAGGSGAKPAQKKWSDWTDKLPADISSEKYEIEEKTLYSSRTREITSSTEKNTLDGWELFETVEANGEFGPWSEWSAEKADSSATREVETQARYRYRDKETSTGSSSAKTGWTLYDTTYSWGNYGSWSPWSETSASKSDSRDVQTKTQYKYRTKSYTTSPSASLSGWTQYDSSSTYGSWSSWSDTPVSGSATREVQTQQVQTGTKYYIAHYCTGNTGDSDQYRSGNWKYSDKCDYHELGWFDSLSAFEVNGSQLTYYPNGSKYRCSNTCYIFYIMSTSGVYKTQYRYRSVSTTYSYYQWSGWSDYSDTYVSTTGDREVSTRTLYRYRDRQSIPTYHFWRWGDWSNWSENKASATNDRQVENTMFYRYRDQAKITTYYFRRWTDWSAYSAAAVDPSESVEVRTKTQYRYKAKES